MSTTEAAAPTMPRLKQRYNDEGRALLAAFGFPFRTGEPIPGLIEEPRKRSRRPGQRRR